MRAISQRVHIYCNLIAVSGLLKMKVVDKDKHRKAIGSDYNYNYVEIT